MNETKATMFVSARSINELALSPQRAKIRRDIPADVIKATTAGRKPLKTP